jgi:hypothetical protein
LNLESRIEGSSSNIPIVSPTSHKMPLEEERRGTRERQEGKGRGEGRIKNTEEGRKTDRLKEGKEKKPATRRKEWTLATPAKKEG